MAQPKTVIASRECHDCKARVQIKLNKNYMAYYYCHCGSHHRFNRAVSAELDAKYERMYGNKKHVPAAANDNPEPEPRAERVRTTGPAANTIEDKAKVTASGEDARTVNTSGGNANKSGGDGRPAAANDDTGTKRDDSGGDWFNDLYG